MTRATRLPFGFGQRVLHKDLPITFRVLSQECGADGSWTVSVTDEAGGGHWRFPQGELTFADLADEQRQMAEWLGCTVDCMNRNHDKIHAWLAQRAGHPSYSLKMARGEPLTGAESEIAAVEEQAVLEIQRYLCTIERLTLLQEAA